MVVSGGVSTEISFPRGGRVSKTKAKSETTKKQFVKEKDLFSNTDENEKNSLKKKLQKKLDKKKAKQDQDKVVKSENVDTLSYGQIVEGMVILGRVSSIRELDLRISLPGRLIASCPITNISGPYTKALRNVTEGGDVDTDSDDCPR